MARHRGGEQHLWLRGEGVLLETQEMGEGGFEHHVFADRDAAVGDLHFLDAEGAALVGDAGGGEHLCTGRGEADTGIETGAGEAFEEFQPQGGAFAGRGEKIGLCLIELIEHDGTI